MNIKIPKDAEALAIRQAKAAGFDNLEDYIVSLIRQKPQALPEARQHALQELKRLRAETPKMTPAEIVEMVAEARAELP